MNIFVKTGEDCRDKGYRSEIGFAQVDGLDPKLSVLLDHWNSIRVEAFAPPWAAFDWDSVPPSLIPHCAVVDVQQNPLNFVYRFWGTGRAALQGGDITGKSVLQFMPAAIAQKAMSEYLTVLDARAPIRIDTSGLKNLVDTEHDYQFLRLPFSDDGKDIHQILSVGSYDQASMKSALDLYGSELLRF